jgi:hypothetical protein
VTLRVQLRIDADTTEGRRALVEFNRHVKGMSAEAYRASVETQRGFVGMRGGIDAARGSLAAFRTVLSAVAAGGLTLFVRSMAGVGAEIADTAEQLGISTGKLQAYRAGAALAGVSTQELTDALRFFGKELGDRTNDVTPFREALARLGLRFEDIKKAGFEKSLELVSDRLSRVADVTERNNIAFELFSRTGIRAINFLASGSEAWARFADEAQRAGLILSKDTLAAAQRADDEFDKLGIALKVAGVNIATGFLPALTATRELMTDASFQAGLKSFSGWLAEIVSHKEAVATLAAGLGSLLIFSRIHPLVGLAAGGAAALATWQAMKSELTQVQERIESIGQRQAVLAFRVANPSAPRREVDRAIAELQRLDAEAAKAWQRYNELQKKVAECPAGGASGRIDIAPIIHPRIEAAIAELRLKRAELEEFKGFADGFGQTLKSLNITGLGDKDIFRMMAGGAGALSSQFTLLNDEMLRYQGALLRLEVETPFERMNRELEKTALLLAKGVISQDTFNRKVASLQFRELTQLNNEWSNLFGQLDQFGAGALSTVASGLARIASGAVSAGEGFKQMGQAVLTMLAEMIIRMLLAVTVGSLLRSVLGAFAPAPAGAPLSLSPPGGGGGPVSVASPSIVPAAAPPPVARASGAAATGAAPFNLQINISNMPPGAHLEERSRSRSRNGNLDVVEMVYVANEQGVGRGRLDGVNRNRYGLRAQPVRR